MCMHIYVYICMYPYVYIYNSGPKFHKTLSYFFFLLLNRVRYYYFSLIVYQLIYRRPRFRYTNNPYSRFDSSKTMTRFFFSIYTDYSTINAYIYVYM